MTTKFDFMTSGEFRRVLETDCNEMNVCFESKAWKAVHVLAGSIVEAVLADFLISEEYKTTAEAGRKNLADTIRILREHNAISKTLADLCSVIKNYRNLVHPGRSIRTSDTVDEHSARVAVSLVEMILKEVSEKKQATYGYTAEQLLSKIRSDPSVEAILVHLLKDVNSKEQERLLMEILPNEYIDSIEDFATDIERELDDFCSVVPKVFRTIFESAEHRLQAKVAKRYVQILKESSGSFVSTYELAFFKLSDTKHLGDEDTQLVKDHFADQLRSVFLDKRLPNCLAGMGDVISLQEFDQFVSPLIKLACQPRDKNVQESARNRLSSEYASSGDKFQTELMKWIDRWIAFYRRIGESNRAEQLNIFKEDIEIPF